MTSEVGTDGCEYGGDGEVKRSVSVKESFNFRDKLSNEINTNQIEFVYIYLIIF